MPSYPLSKSDVGLTVAKSSLAIRNTTQVLTGTQVLENIWFQRQVRVDDNANVTFRNCWFTHLIDTYSWGASLLRCYPNTTTVVENCEFGMHPNDAVPYTGLPWESYYSMVSGITPQNAAGATLECRDSVFHFIGDSVWNFDYMLVEYNWMGDFVLVTESAHVDAIQFIWDSPEGAIVRNNNIQVFINREFSPFDPDDPEVQVAGGGVNRTVFVKPDLEDFTGKVWIYGNFLDGEGYYPLATSNDQLYSWGADSQIYVFDNVIGTGSTVDRFSNQAPYFFQSNNKYENGSLLEGNGMISIKSAEIQEGPNAPSWTITIPEVAEAGDYLALDIHLRSANKYAFSAASLPELVYDENMFDFANVGSGHSMNYIAGFLEEGFPSSFTLDNTDTGFNSFLALVLVLGNVDTSDPIQDYAFEFRPPSGTGAFGTAHQLSPVTCEDEDNLVVSFIAITDNTITFTKPSELTLLDHAQHSTRLHSAMAAYETYDSAGETSGRTYTTSSNAYSIASTIAFRAAPTALPDSASGGYTPPPPSRRLASPYTRERKGNPFKGFSV